MRILVTGAAGFVGQHVVTEAVRQGHVAVAWMRGSGEAGGIPEGSAIVRMDLDSSAAPAMLGEIGADAVIHLAWYARPGDYLHSSENLASLATTLRFARAFQASGGRRFVGVGTCLEYAASPERIPETAPLGPESLYAACKAAAGSVLSTFARGTGLRLAWARLFHLYGPGEDPARLVPSAITAARRGAILHLEDPGKTIDLLHVKDVARALVALTASEVEGPINVCSGVPTRIGGLVDRIGALAGGPRETVSETVADGPTRVGDPSLLLSRTSFRPSVALEQGLEEAVRSERGGP